MILLLPLIPLANIDFSAPMTWAIIIGWIMTVVLHEFAHGFVAYLGGDYTIRERGGLTLNPLQYIEPINSIVLPVVFLAMGGIPLPGGATFIRTKLLRSRWWESAVSAAGPATNFILFLLCSLPFHPGLGWFDVHTPGAELTPGMIFLGAMAQLQMIAVVLNLLPIPPLDGFNIIGPFIPERWRLKLTTPPVSTWAFIGIFLILWKSPVAIYAIRLALWIQSGLHFDFWSRRVMLQCFGKAMGWG